MTRPVNDALADAQPARRGKRHRHGHDRRRHLRGRRDRRQPRRVGVVEVDAADGRSLRDQHLRQRRAERAAGLLRHPGEPDAGAAQRGGHFDPRQCLPGRRRPDPVFNHTVAGRTYYIAVDGATFGDRGAVAIEVRPGPAARPTTTSRTRRSSRASAPPGARSTSRRPPRRASPRTSTGVTANRTVWWKWTAPSADPVLIDACGSDFDTVLAVYTGTAVNALTQIAANQNGTGCSPRSRLTFTPVSGTEYRIAVGAATAARRYASGEVELDIRAARRRPRTTTSPTRAVVPQGRRHDLGPQRQRDARDRGADGRADGVVDVDGAGDRPLRARVLHDGRREPVHRRARGLPAGRDRGRRPGASTRPQELSFCDGQRLDFTVAGRQDAVLPRRRQRGQRRLRDGPEARGAAGQRRLRRRGAAERARPTSTRATTPRRPSSPASRRTGPAATAGRCGGRGPRPTRHLRGRHRVHRRWC